VLDAAGPWGTGPFTLAEGFSSISNICAIMQSNPLECTWLTVSEDRTPYVVLNANNRYWNREREPRLEKVVFRNDLSPQEALKLCISTEGQVDIVTEVSPENAGLVRASQFAKLVAVDANEVVAGVFNCFKSDVNFNDRRIREATTSVVCSEQQCRF
jgi:peptide/nickel transport system substrate-binding protein